MDTMVQFYMEETEDMLQKAEECIIRLEMKYSSDDVNELFRIAHTIKGSSYMVGYDEIGNIMHKIEDMLDCARNGSVMFDRSIVSLCFEGLDIVKKMLEYKKEQGSREMTENLINAASKITGMIETFIYDNKKNDNEKNYSNKEEKKAAYEQPAAGIVSSLLSKKPKGRNKYYITFFIEEDALMVSPVIIMILKSIENVGTLVYSSITDDYFSGCSDDNEIKTLDIILCTDVEEAELYTYFALAYVEKINIVDLTRSKVKENDYYFNNSDNTFYVIILKVIMKVYNILFSGLEEFKIDKEELKVIESLRFEAADAFEKMKDKNKISTFIKDFNEFFSLIIKMYNGQPDINGEFYSNMRLQMEKLIERIYNYIKGKHIFRVFKPEKNNFINRLNNFIEMADNSSTLIILIDLRKLDILYENEVKALIDMKKRMEERNIEVGIIAGGSNARRIINIFDSIKQVEEFNLFKSEINAVIGMFRLQDSFNRIIKKVNSMHCEY